jgi:multidrug efflux pump subunit AcrB
MAFILGVVPLVWATGAGAELRQALGTPVFAGMIGVTFFGLLVTPVFFVVSRRLGRWASRTPSATPRPARR